MKKRYLLGVIFFLLVFKVEAAKYDCSNSTKIEKDVKEIKLEYVKYFNGIGIGNVYSRETPAIGRMDAELILEAQRLTLDLSNKPKEEIELSTGKINFLVKKTMNVCLIIVLEKDAKRSYFLIT